MKAVDLINTTLPSSGVDFKTTGISDNLGILSSVLMPGTPPEGRDVWSFQIGGRLQHFLPFWYSICKDHRVLSIISGAKFEFNEEFCYQEKLPRVLKMSQAEHQFMDDKIKELL